jgi:GT2 family glycosyltransferase
MNSPLADSIPRFLAAAAAQTELAKPQAGPTQTMMVRAEIFDSVGLFNPKLTHRDSADWLLRAREAGVGFLELDDVLVHRRIHDNNMSLNRGQDDAEDLFAIIQQRLARESASSGS